MIGALNRRLATVLVALVPIVAFGVLLSGVTVPFVSEGPGPTFDTLGEVDGKQVVNIEGAEVHPTSGHLNMTTVALSDGLTLGQALALWLSGNEQLLPRDLVYPPGKSRDDVDKENTSDFKSSEDNAEFAALDYLHFPKVATVGNITDDGPSKGKLQPGDAIDSVNGKPVADAGAFLEIVKTTKPGDLLLVGYRRKNAPAGTAAITLGSSPDRTRGFLGVGVIDAPWAPFTIDFHLANIGGPSAGLMFSLAVVDKLTNGDLNGGKFIAGTGAINGDGKVGPIGGIAHKMYSAKEAGASAFLVPTDNCAEAMSAHINGMRLIKVDTLTTAVDALKTYSAGGEPPRC